MITVKEFIGFVIIALVAIALAYREGYNDAEEFAELDKKASNVVQFNNGRKSMQDEIEERAEKYYYQDSISPLDLEMIIFGESQL